MARNDQPAYQMARPSTKLIVGLAVAAGIVALWAAVAAPTIKTVFLEQDGQRLQVASEWSPLQIAFAVTQLLAAVLAFGGAVLTWTSRLVPARRVLAGAGVVGLFPAMVPGVLALSAWALLRRRDS
jgi:hypothetical protein